MSGIDSFTQLLLHCDGSNGSTTFTDSSSAARTVTANSGAALTTAQQKFGTASGLFDGTDDYLSLADAAALELGSGDFTIDFWFRPNSIAAGNRGLVSKRPAGGFDTPIIIMQNADGIQLYMSSAAVSFDVANARQIVPTSSLATGTWYHFALVRNGTSITTYLNGSQTDTFTSSATLRNNANSWYIGADRPTSSPAPFNGWIDEVRFSIGVARWTTGFTPPTAAYDIYETGVGSSAGVGAASGVGRSTAASVAATAGVGAASGVGASTAESIAASSGIATASGVGQSTFSAVATSAAAATASAVGENAGAVYQDGVASAAGVASVTGVGRSTAEAVAASAGAGAAAGVGASIASAVGTCTGQASVNGVSNVQAFVEAIASAQGIAIVIGQGAAVGERNVIAPKTPLNFVVTTPTKLIQITAAKPAITQVIQ